MPILYPLRFEPIFRRYLWGGRKLATVLNKPIGPESCAESWEIVDRPNDQSRVSIGPLAGKTLGEIVRDHGEALLGRHHPQTQFPLLLKFLDCEKTLSVQVHPSDEQAARLTPPDHGKTEAWIVVSAESDTLIYAGLKRGFDRGALERELNRGTCDLCLHRFEPSRGDCIFLQAGTVHALGAGLLMLEIQQNSDATLRIFDWNRLGPDGKSRPLHIAQALEVIDFSRGPVSRQTPQPTDRPHITRLVECDKFVLDRWEFMEPVRIGGDNRFHIIAVLHGAADILCDPEQQTLTLGDTILLPADHPRCFFIPDGPSTLVDIYLP
ncbi:MAG: class I mannose-6-phosphate isomerase [Pirellulales bacterium]|nr:class I mannose-6-phosphate isomerase [Pirellulales bacterium]